MRGTPASVFSIAGRMWPPHPPAGTFSPLGRREGSRTRLVSYRRNRGRHAQDARDHTKNKKAAWDHPAAFSYSNRLSRLLDNDDLGLAARTDAAVQVDNVLVDQTDAA